MFEFHSPLDKYLAASGHVNTAGASAVRFTVLRDWRLLQIGTFGGSQERDDLERLNETVSSLFGCPLPESASVVTRSGAHSLYRIASDQYWLVTPAAGLLEALAQAISSALASLTPLSHARVRIALAGPAVCALLGKVVPIDLRLRQFPAGHFAQTDLHHTGVLLERLGPEHFEIYALRTYAASIWEWLTDAALPYGYEVRSEAAKDIAL